MLSNRWSPERQERDMVKNDKPIDPTNTIDFCGQIAKIHEKINKSVKPDTFGIPTKPMPLHE